MKANFLNRSLWLPAILLTSLFATAQTKTKAKTADNSISNRMYDIVNMDGDSRIEKVQTDYKGKIYTMKLINEKMTELTVDGERIPESYWNKYSDGISAIREQIRLQKIRNAEQAKRNAEQAVRNEEQAKRNAEQAVKNQEQEKRNAEQVVKNQGQAKRNEEQNKLNAEQAIRNQEQAKRDQERAGLNEEQQKKNAEQAIRNQEQNKRNAEQAVRNQEQAKQNEKQAKLNEIQAKKNEEQARANEKFMKDITEDLVNDKIIPDNKSLREMKLNEFGMSVNGKKLPEELFKKYKEKYKNFFEGNFDYSRDGIIQGTDPSTTNYLMNQ